MTNTTELRECPFCGGGATVEQVESDDCWSVGCEDCDFQLMTGEWSLGWYKSKEKAIAAWNRRASAVPEGFVIVPKEPTESMVVNGFESWPNQFFSKPEDWEAYEAMTGCQQAAHRAKLCWSAMINAAPQEKEGV